MSFLKWFHEGLDRNRVEAQNIHAAQVETATAPPYETPERPSTSLVQAHLASIRHDLAQVDQRLVELQRIIDATSSSPGL